MSNEKIKNPHASYLKSTIENPLDEQFLKSTESELKHHARSLGIPAGAAEVFIEKSLKSAQKSLKGKTIITEADFSRALTRELKKYHADLAYVYENYDKII